jgi:uncharacterized protein (DUF1330 family)
MEMNSKTPPGYVIAEVDVTDPATFRKYSERVAETLVPFNARFLIRGGKAQTVEGEPPKRIVMLVFDSAEKARGWYDSPAYQAIAPIRHESAKTRIFIVEGLTPD